MFVFTADSDLTDRCGRISGFHVAETAGAAAVVNLRNGSASGPIFIQVRIPAVTGGQSVHFSASTRITFPKGLYVDVVSGTVQGSIQPG